MTRCKTCGHDPEKARIAELEAEAMRTNYESLQTTIRAAIYTDLLPAFPTTGFKCYYCGVLGHGHDIKDPAKHAANCAYRKLAELVGVGTKGSGT